MQRQKLGILIVMMMLLSVGAVSASHTADVSLTPDSTNCDEAGKTFTVNIANQGGSSNNILQVEIYKAPAGIVPGSFVCGVAPSGWTLFSFTDRCIYVTELDSVDKIAPGQDRDFTFDAVMNLDSCNSEFTIVTVDDDDPEGDRDTVKRQVKIDCTAPDVYKIVGDPKLPLGPGDNDYWITQDTPLTAYASDDQGQCDLGLDYCTIYYTVDGGSEILEEEAHFDQGVFDWDYSWKFGEDSEHFINITCWDVAGNMAYVTETDKVDDTPPVTTKVISDPKKIEGDVEWIDSVTEITLSAVDPEHPDTVEGYDCSIGVDETYYRITQVPDEVCLSPAELCNPIDAKDDFMVWDGTPITDIPESCHLMEYYSVDEIGNVEDIKTNCFFVDKSAPVAYRTFGEPQVGDCPSPATYCDGWACLGDDQKDFFVTGRYGNQAQPAQNKELILWEVDGATETTMDDDDFVWQNGVAVPFSVSYDPATGAVEYIVDGVTLGMTYELDKAFDYVLAFAKGNAKGNDVLMEDLMLNGKLLGDLYSDGAYKGLQIPLSDAQQASGFTLTGMVTLFWEASPKDELPAFHVFAMNTHDLMPGECWIRDDYNNMPGTPVTLDCVDQMPHPAGDEEICYQVSYDYPDWGYITDSYCDGALDDGWCCVDAPKTLLFMEDSMHNLEYFCRDAVEKESPVEIDYFRVDSLAPIIEKEMIGTAHLGVCPPGPEPSDDECYVADNGENGVRITAYDDDSMDCAVDDLSCRYQVRWMVDETECFENDGKWNGELGWCLVDSGAFTDTVDVIFTEDSTHELYIYCQDALGNWAEDLEEFLVDSTPPVTTKTYDEEKSVVKDGYRWILDDTLIEMDAVDAKVGVDRIEYRVTLIGDDVCPEACDEEGSGDWTTVAGDHAEFVIPEESCHYIEFFAVDLLGNTELVNSQCVMVDDSAPEMDKVIGEPKVEGEMLFPTGMVCDEPGAGSECADARTFTLDADFDEGILNGVQHDTVSDQLQLTIGGATDYPLMWIANAGEDSVSKFNTETGEELARYHTWFGALGHHGSWEGPAPSRTAVDSEGNAYVANRQFPYDEPANVFKILANDWIDRNGNGVLDTSFDADSNGEIEPDEMLPFYDDNANGIIDDDEIVDERIAWVANVGTDNCLGRSLAIDMNGDIWVGCYSEEAYYKIDGSDGSPLLGPISVSGHTPYGAIVDNDGILWGASLSSNLLKLDTNTGTVLNIYSHSSWGGDYGIAIAYDDEGDTLVYKGSQSGRSFIKFESDTETFSTPGQAAGVYTLGIATDSNGDIFVGDSGGSGRMYKFHPDGTLVWSSPGQVASEIRGTVVDSDDNVWAIHRAVSKAAKFDGTDGTHLGVFDTGYLPYTYSDATGVGLLSAISSGKWTVEHDSGAAGSAWGLVSWTEDVPADTSLTVRARSSEDGIAWSSWETADNGVALSATPDGRYLQVEVSMKSTTDESPILYDLTIEGDCGDVVCEEERLVDVTYIAQQTPLTLSCWDADPHPVGDVTLEWRYRTAETCEELGEIIVGDEGGWTKWMTAYDPVLVEEVFRFPEDSCHQLEYRCTDGLGIVSESKFEIDIVDSVGPVIETEIIGPTVTVEGDVFIDGITEIEVDAYDPDPHPVGDVWCDWGYWWNDEWYEGGVEETLPFTIGGWEESQHDLVVKCVDALGNGNTLEETYFVDHTAPGIDKWYDWMFWDIYEDENGTYLAKFTGADALIHGAVWDEGPHKSGIDEVEYLVTLVENDDDCKYYLRDGPVVADDVLFTMKTEELVRPMPMLDYEFDCDNASVGDWVTVPEEEWDDFTFTAGEESCHMIEIMATDNVGKCRLHRQYVYVDDTPPETAKVIGEPKTQMSEGNIDLGSNYFEGLTQEFCGEAEENCMSVTLLTGIDLACNDPEPHPSGGEAIYFMVEFDGDDLTSEYCEQAGGVYIDDVESEHYGFCYLAEGASSFHFTEESWHKLTYYCEDNVGNVGVPDIEYFKVEGTSFKIHLNKKWNLISVPVKLQDDSMGAVWDDQPGVVSVWGYDGTNWHVYTPDGVANDDLTTMLPGDGYWVLTTEESDLVIGGSLLSPTVTPPDKQIVHGWNLVGYYGVDGAPMDGDVPYYNGPNLYGNGKPAALATATLGDDWLDKPFASLWTYWEVDNPDQWKALGLIHYMNPGAGYWLFYPGESGGIYAPSTIGQALV